MLPYRSRTFSGRLTFPDAASRRLFHLSCVEGSPDARRPFPNGGSAGDCRKCRGGSHPMRQTQSAFVSRSCAIYPFFWKNNPRPVKWPHNRQKEFRESAGRGEGNVASRAGDFPEDSASGRAEKCRVRPPSAGGSGGMFLPMRAAGSRCGSHPQEEFCEISGRRRRISPTASVSRSVSTTHRSRQWGAAGPVTTASPHFARPGSIARTASAMFHSCTAAVVAGGLEASPGVTSKSRRSRSAL